MKKNADTELRPDFALMTLSDTISFFHMQMPRWLFSTPRCAAMSLEAKVAYTFLLNRYQLSRRNGWINRHGEVYIIYTREDLAREMQISYRKAIACFKELAAHHLIWEQRQGRGLPNRIFLAEVVPEEKVSYAYDCAPFSPAPRPAENAGLENDCLAPADLAAEETEEDTGTRDAKTTHQEVQQAHCKTCENGTSRDAKTAVPDLPKPHASKKEIIKKENRNTEEDSIVPHAERDVIPELLKSCDMSRYDAQETAVLRNAVSWLYYCEQLRIGGCTYPQAYVRDALCRLNDDILDDTLCKLVQSAGEVRSNTLVYTAKVLFSTILEMESEALLDPLSRRGGRGRSGCAT